MVVARVGTPRSAPPRLRRRPAAVGPTASCCAVGGLASALARGGRAGRSRSRWSFPRGPRRSGARGRTVEARSPARARLARWNSLRARCRDPQRAVGRDALRDPAPLSDGRGRRVAKRAGQPPTRNGFRVQARSPERARLGSCSVTPRLGRAGPADPNVGCRRVAPGSPWVAARPAPMRARPDVGSPR